MDYYAFLDENNVVTQVIPGREQGSDNIDWEKRYEEFQSQVCKRSRTDGFRKNYAGIGYTYDATRDAFIPPQPFPSWTLNEETCQWGAPVAMLDDGKIYNWNESSNAWLEVEIGQSESVS